MEEEDRQRAMTAETVSSPTAMPRKLSDGKDSALLVRRKGSADLSKKVTRLRNLVGSEVSIRKVFS